MTLSNDVLVEIIPVTADEEGIFVLLPTVTATGQRDDIFWLEWWRVDEHPTATASFYLNQKLAQPPLILHSTSWRMIHFDKGPTIILTYLAVMPETSRSNPAVTVLNFSCRELEIARGGSVSPPCEVRAWHVVSHALQHLNWLSLTDKPIQRSLSPAWRGYLKHFTLRGFLAQ